MILNKICYEYVGLFRPGIKKADIVWSKVSNTTLVLLSLKSFAEPFSLGNNNHIWRFCEVNVWLPTFAVSWSQFHCGQTSNLGSFVDMATKLHSLAVTRRLFGPAGKKLSTLAVTWTVFGPARLLLTNMTSILSSFTVTLKMPKFLIICSFQSDRETAIYGSSVG
jgi:hypothetical protein